LIYSAHAVCFCTLVAILYPLPNVFNYSFYSFNRYYGNHIFCFFLWLFSINFLIC
jgi:hypothetical protein